MTWRRLTSHASLSGLGALGLRRGGGGGGGGLVHYANVNSGNAAPTPSLLGTAPPFPATRKMILIKN